MTTTYRTDWLDHDDAVQVQHYPLHMGDKGQLTAARLTARQKSKRHGGAYVIKTVDGQDVAQLVYKDGRACSHGWDDG